MNTINKIKFIILATAGLITLNSCVKDDDFSLPQVVCNETWVSNLTIPELFQQVDAANDIIAFDTDVIFEGYVISSDSTGNFFKTVSIQDSRTNPTKGLQTEMDRTNLFNNYPLGAKIKVNLKGLYAGYDNGLLKVGETYEDDGAIRVGRMADNKINSHVALTCEAIEDITPVTFPDIASAKASGVINTLVTIQNVQFSETGITYANAADQQTLNLDIEGATEQTNGQKIVLRNSGFADFANVIVPEGSGSITAVLSKFGSTWQLFIRDTDDVKFDQPRYESDGGGGEGNDQEALNFLFPGADFENWTNFLGSLNSFGLTDGLAVQSPGTGRDGSNSFHLNGTTGSTNPYVFTVRADTSTIPTNATKITMWIKGSSAKSLSFNLDTTSGRVYYNIGEFGTGNVTLSPQANNQYLGAVDTNGEWRLVTLNITGLTLNTTGDLLALKAGSGTTYNLHIDHIKID